MSLSKEKFKEKFKKWWHEFSTDKPEAEETDEQTETQEESVTDDFLAKKSKPAAKGIRKNSVFVLLMVVAGIAIFAVFYGVDKKKETREESHIYKEVVESRKAVGNHLQHLPGDYSEDAAKAATPVVVPKEEKPQIIVEEVKRPELPKQPERHEKTRDEIEAEAAYEAEQEAYKSPVKFDIKFDEK